MIMPKQNGLTVVRTYMERGTMGALTYNNLRLQKLCYHEFDEMLITELAVLGNSSIEITEEISYLVGNGIKSAVNQRWRIEYRDIAKSI